MRLPCRRHKELHRKFWYNADEVFAVETMAAGSAPETAQDLEEALARLMTQIAEIRQQMQADNVSIRQSNAEYVILRAESQKLRVQTENILAGAWKNCEIMQ